MGTSVCDSHPKLKTMRKQIEKIALNFFVLETREAQVCETIENAPSLGASVMLLPSFI